MSYGTCTGGLGTECAMYSVCVDCERREARVGTGTRQSVSEHIPTTTGMYHIDSTNSICPFSMLMLSRICFTTLL